MPKNLDKGNFQKKKNTTKKSVVENEGTDSDKLVSPKSFLKGKGEYDCMAKQTSVNQFKLKTHKRLSASELCLEQTENKRIKVSANEDAGSNNNQSPSVGLRTYINDNLNADNVNFLSSSQFEKNSVRNVQVQQRNVIIGVDKDISSPTSNNPLSPENPLTLSPSSLSKTFKRQKIVRKILPSPRHLVEKKSNDEVKVSVSKRKSRKQALKVRTVENSLDKSPTVGCLPSENTAESSYVKDSPKTSVKIDKNKKGKSEEVYSTLESESINWSPNDTQKSPPESSVTNTSTITVHSPSELLKSQGLNAKCRPRPMFLFQNNHIKSTAGKSKKQTVPKNLGQYVDIQPLSEIPTTPSMHPENVNINEVRDAESGSTSGRDSGSIVQAVCSVPSKLSARTTAQTEYDVSVSIKTEKEESETVEFSTQVVHDPDIVIPSMKTENDENDTPWEHAAMSDAYDISSFKTEDESEMAWEHTSPYTDALIPSVKTELDEHERITETSAENIQPNVLPTPLLPTSKPGSVSVNKIKITPISRKPNILSKSVPAKIAPKLKPTPSSAAVTSSEGKSDPPKLSHSQPPTASLPAMSTNPAVPCGPQAHAGPCVPQAPAGPCVPQAPAPTFIPSPMIRTNPVISSNMIPRFPNVSSGICYPPPFIIPTSSSHLQDGLGSNTTLSPGIPTQKLLPALLQSGYKLGNLIIQTTPVPAPMATTSRVSPQTSSNILNPTDQIQALSTVTNSMKLPVTNSVAPVQGNTAPFTVNLPKVNPEIVPDTSMQEKVDIGLPSQNLTQAPITLVIPNQSGTGSTTVVVNDLNFGLQDHNNQDSSHANNTSSSVPSNVSIFPSFKADQSSDSNSSVTGMPSNQTQTSFVSGMQQNLIQPTPAQQISINSGQTVSPIPVISSVTSLAPDRISNMQNVTVSKSSIPISKSSVGQYVKIAPDKPIPKAEDYLKVPSFVKIVQDNVPVEIPMSHKPIPSDKPELKDPDLDDVLIHVRYKRKFTRNKTRSMYIYDPIWRSMIKSYVSRESNSRRLAKQLYQIPELLNELHKRFLKQLESECQQLCSPKTRTMLRKKDPPDLENIRFEEFLTDLHHEAPLLKSVLDVIKGDKCPDQNLGIMAAVMLFSRHNALSSIHHVITRILRKGGASTQTVDLLAAMGLCITTSSYVLNVKRYCERTGDNYYRSWLRHNPKYPDPKSSEPVNDSDVEISENLKSTNTKRKARSSPPCSSNKKRTSSEKKVQRKSKVTSLSKPSILNRSKSKSASPSDQLQKNTCMSDNVCQTRTKKLYKTNKNTNKNKRQSDVSLIGASCISSSQTDIFVDSEDDQETLKISSSVSNSANTSVSVTPDLCSDVEVDSDVTDTATSGGQYLHPCVFEDDDDNDEEDDDDDVLLQELSLSEFEESDYETDDTADET